MKDASRLFSSTPASLRGTVGFGTATLRRGSVYHKIRCRMLDLADMVPSKSIQVGIEFISVR
jgi:hypothetical protein